MNTFYKTAVILAICICVASVFQSYQLRSQIKSLKDTISDLEGTNAVLSLESQERAREEGYKECIIDAQMGKSRYLVTEKTNGMVLWKLEETINKKSN